jgi:hypothetical protein
MAPGFHNGPNGSGAIPLEGQQLIIGNLVWE